MKKLITVSLITLVSGIGYCVNPQPQNLGTATVDYLIITPQTLASIDALTPDATGQLVICSNCDFALCVSTGAQSLAKGGFVVAASTNPAAAQGAVMHCQ